jgi:hypothetical protein
LALRPCAMLVAGLASRLLYFLFGIAMHGLVALIALVTVIPLVPGACSGGTTNQRSVTMAFRPRGQVRVEDTRCCPSSCTSVRWVKYCSLCIWGLVGSCRARSAASAMAPIGVQYSLFATAAKVLLRLLWYIGLGARFSMFHLR